MREILPYGAWKSPVSAAAAAAAGGGPEWVEWAFGEVWWAESRPTEDGRIALARAPGEDVLPAGWNVRNRLHEYGGRPWARLSPTRVAFTHWDDQRVYVAEVGGTPEPLSPEPERRHGYRYGDLMPGRDGEVWCVRETVTGDLPTDIRRDLVALGGPDGLRVLGASHHFMSGPKISPDGTRAAWIGWEHPNMPWDGTELCVADIQPDGTFGPHRVLAGGPREAVCQVDWEDDSHLLALSDPSGWWNLFRIGLDGTSRNLAPCEEELGGAMWRVGPRWFAALGAGRFAVLRSGVLAILDEKSGTVTDVDTDVTAWRADVWAGDGVVYGAAGSPTLDIAVVALDLSRGELTTYTTQESPIDPAYLPVPEARVFPGPDGRQIPAYVYPPTNPDYDGPADERPPYMVYAHGGPTGRFSAVLNLEIAFLTSRGIGVAAVNYGGSVGYGRAFRESLNEQWGVVDVQDCAAVAEALAAEGVADPDRLAIQGGSAGGWTAAASMTMTRTYRCATIMYPVLDLTEWTDHGGETHDFESRYIEGLVGRLPEHADRYRDRSPAYHVDNLAGPVLLLQGLEDQVCPPEQANRFVASLEGTGIPHAYLTFEGEQHGFRRADSLVTSINATLSFYGQVFGFVPPEVPVLELRS